MALTESINLIPRNNWDFGLDAVVTAIRGIKHGVAPAPSTAHTLGQQPIWTNAGRTSLFVILRALDLTPGSEVGVPLFCCSVVFEAIRQAGCTPRFIDSGVHDYNMSVEDLRTKRSDLAAVVPVHMFGDPADMDGINNIAEGLPVIEDCAQSLFSTYRGSPTGVLSTASFFSFRCGKYISAGEGSAVICRGPELRERVLAEADALPAPTVRGMLTDTLLTSLKARLYNRPWYGLIGRPVGMRLDRKLNLTAKDGFRARRVAVSNLAVVEERISGFRELVERQREHARMLLERLEPGPFALPVENPEDLRNWFQFPLGFDDVKSRDRMADHLLSRGVDTAKYLDDIANIASVHYGYQGDCPNAEHLARTTLLVPIHYNLSEADIERVACAINEVSHAS